jgi:acetyl-CoA synthetase
MALENKSGSITSVLQETRVFPPASEFARTAHVSSIEEYQALWNRAKDDPEGFWGEQARQLLSWSRPWEQVLDWKAQGPGDLGLRNSRVGLHPQ